MRRFLPVWPARAEVPAGAVLPGPVRGRATGCRQRPPVAQPPCRARTRPRRLRAKVFRWWSAFSRCAFLHGNGGDGDSPSFTLFNGREL